MFGGGGGGYSDIFYMHRFGCSLGVEIFNFIFFFFFGGGGGFNKNNSFLGWEIFVDIWGGGSLLNLIIFMGYLLKQLLLFVFCDEIYHNTNYNYYQT